MDPDTFIITPQVGAELDIQGGGPTTSPGDSLVLDAGGGDATVDSMGGISINGAMPISLVDIEDTSLVNVGTLTVTGDAASPNAFAISVDPDVPGGDLLTNGGNTIPVNNVDSIVFQGGADDDTLVFDTDSGLTTTPIRFEGQGQTGATGGDQIRIQGSTAASFLGFDSVDASEGTIRFDESSSITYLGTESVESTIAAGSVSLNLSNASETLDLTQAGSNLISLGTMSVPTTLVAPSGSLNIITGGSADIVNVNGLDLALDRLFQIIDPDASADDLVNFQNGPTTIANGALNVRSLDVTVTSALNVGGTVTFDAQGSTGTTSIGADITTTNGIQFNGPVVLTEDVTIEAPCVDNTGIRFSSTLDGNQALTINGFDAVFTADVGGLAPLVSLTVNGGSASFSGSVSTSTTQSFDSPVFVTGSISFDASPTGNVTFNQTISGTTPGADSLLINGQNVAINGDAGAISPLLRLDAVAQTSVDLNANLFVNQGASLTALDGNVAISATSAIAAAGGDVALEAGDDVNIPAGATITADAVTVTIDQSDNDPEGGSATLAGAIDAPASGLTVMGGSAPDTFNVSPQVNANVAVDGSDPSSTPGDALFLDASGADVVFNTNGTITVGGFQPVSSAEIELVSLTNANTLSVLGDVSDDLISLSGDGSGDQLAVNGTIIDLNAVNSIVIDGGDGNDEFVFDATLGLPATPVTFNGQTQNGGTGDVLTIQGSFTTQTLNYAPPGTDGNNGSVDLDGAAITYTGLEPINAGNSVDTILNLPVGLANDATLRASLIAGSIELVDNGTTFEDTLLPNPTGSLVINLGDQGDLLTIDPLDAGFTAATAVIGGSGTDTFATNTGGINSLQVTATGNGTGAVALDALNFDLASIEQIDTSADATQNASLTFSTSDEMLTLGGTGGTFTASSSLGQTVVVGTPATGLFVDTGMGADTVTVNATDTQVNDFIILDSDVIVDDDVIVAGAVTNPSGGLEIVAHDIDVNNPITATAGAVVLGFGGDLTATVNLASTVDANLIQFDSPTFLPGNANLNADLIDFSSTLDGPGELAVTSPGSDLIFNGAVGATTPLAALDVIAINPIQVTTSVTTVGDQTYQSPVVANDAGALALTSQTGTVSLLELDDDNSPSDITVNSALPIVLNTLGQAIAPNNFTVNTAGPLTLNSLITANNDVTINILDTAGTDDDINIEGIIDATTGDITITAGDDLTIDGIAALTAGANINLNVDPVAGDADTEGGTVTTSGILSGNVQVTGGDDADTFIPVNGGNFFFDGGDSTSSPDGDILDFGFASGMVQVSSSQAFHPISGSTIDLANVEVVTVLNSSDVTVTGANTTLAAVPASTSVTVAIGGGPAVLLDTTNTLVTTINGTDADDTFTVDVTNGLPSETVNFNGGLNLSTNPGDQIFLVGTSPASITNQTFNYINNNDGSVDLDGTTIVNYTGLEPITSSIDSTNAILNFSSASELINVTSSGTDVVVDSTSGEITTFAAPSDNISISTGGGIDSVVVDGLSTSLAGEFLIDDIDQDDTVTFDITASTISTGRLSVPVPTIEVIADLLVDGDVTLGAGSGTGQVVTAASIISMGDIVFDEPVSLTGTTSASTDADSLVTFHFPVDGGQDLTVIGGTGVEFLGENGRIAELASLSATTSSGVIRIDDVLTFGDQTYNSPVAVNSGGGTVDLLSSTGTLTFASTIDNQGAVPNSLNTSSDGETVFGGAIGSVSQLDTLTVRASGTTTISNDITAFSNIDFSTSDGGDDNLVIQSPAVISTDITGTIRFDVLDNIDIQAGATINTMTLDIIVDDPLVEDDNNGSQVMIAGSINASSATNVTGGTESDTFTILPQANSILNLDGGDPTTSPGDVFVIDGGGNDVTIDAQGNITVTGAMPINPTSIEDLGLVNVNVLTVAGDIGDDVVTLETDPNNLGADLLTVGTSAPISLTGITSLVFDAGDGDDTFVFDAIGAIPTTPVTFNGQAAGVGIGDALTILGLFNAQTLNYTAAGVGGNNGTVDLDGTLLTYTGLEPINAGDSFETILNFSTGFANNATLQNSVNAGEIEIIDNGATFEDTVIPNPISSLTVNLDDNGDTLSVATLDAAFTASLIINGGLGVDDVTLDTVSLVNTAGRGLDIVEVETTTIVNSTFSGNNASIGAGASIIGGTVSISGSTFSNNSSVTSDQAAEGGGGLFITGDVTIDDSDFTDNFASGPVSNGGGILVGPGGTLDITNSTFTGNQANGPNGFGGGVFVLDGNVTFSNVTFDANAATIDGGGLYAAGATATVDITDATVTNNIAGDSGGGVFTDGPAVTVTGSTFTGNEAQGNAGLDGDGGGIFIGSLAGTSTNTFTIDSSTFDNNTSEGGGGGVFVLDLDGTIDGGSISLNQVTGNGITFDSGGGGITIVGLTRVNTVGISGVTIDTNTGTAGGGVAVVDALVSIDNSSITNNMATSALAGGGGIGALATVPLVGNLLTIQDSQIVNNTTAGEGGGIGIINGDLFTLNTQISMNAANGGRGGGIGLLNNGIMGTATLRATTIDNNTALASGGGIAVSDTAIDLENVTISTNQAGGEGGGISHNNVISSVSSSISFSTITSNTAPAGGSNVAATGSSIDVTGTIFDNGEISASGVLNSLGSNLDSGNTGGLTGAGDLVNTDPMLGPLQDNGGSVLTLSLIHISEPTRPY